MPYEKVSIVVAMVITVFISIALNGNFVKDAPVAVVDLDNSAYTRELISRMDASEYIKITKVLHTPTDVNTLFYEDQAVAAVYFPQGLEKDHYTGVQTNIGAFYDQTNMAQSGNVKAALNQIVGFENTVVQGDTGSTNDVLSGSMQIADRTLFNPQMSTSNGLTMGFLFLFGTMFFTFATIGMVPRLRQSGELVRIFANGGTPGDIIIRLLPYGCCLLASFALGLAILRVWGDLNFSGSSLAFLVTQILFIAACGMLNLFMGWGAASPALASSRMILYIPEGFVWGGLALPKFIFAKWVMLASHIFPLTWEFHFQRDIMARGAGLSDISSVLGAFLLYMAAIALLVGRRFYKEREAYFQKKAQEDPQALAA